MKLKSYPEKNIERRLFIVLGVILALFLFLFTRCSTVEQLTKPNLNDRIITGYSKNMKRYKVVDQYDRPCIDIFIGDTLRPVGGVFLALERY